MKTTRVPHCETYPSPSQDLFFLVCGFRHWTVQYRVFSPSADSLRAEFVCIVKGDRGAVATAGANAGRIETLGIKGLNEGLMMEEEEGARGVRVRGGGRLKSGSMSKHAPEWKSEGDIEWSTQISLPPRFKISPSRIRFAPLRAKTILYILCHRWHPLTRLRTNSPLTVKILKLY